MRNLFLLCFSIWFVAVGAQVRMLSTDNGLSSSLINDILQDCNGMIWIATEDGLNRYDGAKLTVYKHNPSDEHSLCHNYVRTLMEDNKGRLFVGTYDGIQLYHPDTDNFSKVAVWEDGNIFHNNVVFFLERDNGEIWASGNTLCKLDCVDGKLFASKLKLSMPTQKVDYMQEDVNGNIWSVIAGRKIALMNNKGDVTYFLEGDEELHLTGMCEGDDGSIYVGSMEKGLLKYDTKKEQFIQIPYNGNCNLPVKSLYKDNEGHIYACTDGMGVKILNRKGQMLVDTFFDLGNLDSKRSKIHFMLKDNSDNIWLGLYQKGVFMIPKLGNEFYYLGYKSVERNLIGSNNINSICKDSEDILWIGTDNDGVYGILPNGKGRVHWGTMGKKSSVPNVVMAIYEDSERNLWLGSYLGGMSRLDRKTGHCTSVKDLLNKQGNPVEYVYDFVEDADKRLWIATMGDGLFCYDLKTQRIVKDLPKLFNNRWVTNLYYSTDNKLYVGTYDGVGCVDLSTGDYKTEWFLRRQIVLSIYGDPMGNIWLGTSSGLVEWKQNNNDFVTYTQEHGLPSNAVYGIEGDANGCLWLSTNAGLAQFNVKTHEIVNYYVTDGLQGNEFSKNASFKDDDGIIYFGGISGITYFNPLEISNPAKKWTVRISDFYLNNRSVRKGVTSGGKPIIDCPVYEAERFNLGYEDNTFSVEFTTLEFNAGERIVYHYTMGNNEWIALPKGVNRISFSNLAPGSYDFRVKVVDNGMESDVKRIVIVIRPPWWATWWAKTIYVLLFIGAVCLFILHIRHRYRVRQEMLKHEHAEQLNEAKLQFFINISHEIRTPMSLIINPLQRLIDNDTDETRGKTYRMIYRNANRILRLMNQLMDLRKIDKRQMQLVFRNTEMVGFINDLCETFAQQAEQRQINLSFFHDGLEELYVWIDPANFDKVVMNILSNAFKFTSEKGQIDVYLRMGTEPSNKVEALREFVEIVVEDSGIGIDEKELELIFNRFYQIKGVVNNSGVGTGIGLHLTRSLVELHHGTIVAQNNKNGIGSSFIIRLPLGNKHLSNEDMMVAPVGLPKPQLTVSEVWSEEKENVKTRTKTAYRVLIVEDDREIRRYLHQEMSEKYHIQESDNGKDALDIIFKWNPDLVISDIMMPEMDGLSLCRKIKQNVNLNTIPVILLTAKTQDEDNLEGLEMGADAYIAKPFNIDILLKTIDNLIHIREQLKNMYTGQQSQEDRVLDVNAQSPDEKLLERIMKVINDNLDNPNLNVEMLTQEVGISRVHLHRKLKQLTNQSTRELIRNIRLKQAAKLLREKRYPIAEVAALTGFTSPNNFATLFRELYGMPPTAYMEQHLSNKEEN